MSGKSFISGLPRPLVPLLAAISACVLLLVLFNLVTVSADETSGHQAPPVYAELADGLDLQSDPEILSAEEDWQARAGLSDTDSLAGNWFTALLSRIDIAFLIRALIWLVAAGIAFAIALLIWRYGSVIQVGITREAGKGDTSTGGLDLGPALAREQKTLTLDDVLSIEDESVAIGALQRLVLETALSSINATLSKSETARAVLHRLPREWRHFGLAAAIVRLAERVRFAGERLDRDGLIAAVEQARPILREARGQA